MKNEIASMRCPLCDSDPDSTKSSHSPSKVIADHECGEMICSGCGMVIYEQTDTYSRQISRSFCNEVRYNETMARPHTFAYHCTGLSTNIGRINKDAKGQKLDPGTFIKMKRLRKWDFKTQICDSTDRNLMSAFRKLEILKDRLGLPNPVMERTAYLYRKAQHRGLVKGRTIDEMLTAAVYAACRDLGVPKTLNEIAQAGSVPGKGLSKSYRLLSRELDISIPFLDPMKCIAKIANKANLNEGIKRKAISIMNLITEKEISAGKNPMGLAATVLYICCRETGVKKTQIAIATAAGVTGVTLRNRSKELKNKLELYC